MLRQKAVSLTVMVNGGFEQNMNIDIWKPLYLFRGRFLDITSSAQ